MKEVSVKARSWPSRAPKQRFSHEAVLPLFLLTLHYVLFAKAGELGVHPSSRPWTTARDPHRGNNFVVPPGITGAAQRPHRSGGSGALRAPGGIAEGAGALCSAGRAARDPPASEWRQNDLKGSQEWLQGAQELFFIVCRDGAAGAARGPCRPSPAPAGNAPRAPPARKWARGGRAGRRMRRRRRAAAPRPRRGGGLARAPCARREAGPGRRGQSPGGRGERAERAGGEERGRTGRGCEDGGAADAAGGGDPGGAPGPVRQLHEPGAGGRVLRDQLHPGACGRAGPGRAGQSAPSRPCPRGAPLAGPAGGRQRRLLQPAEGRGGEGGKLLHLQPELPRRDEALEYGIDSWIEFLPLCEGIFITDSVSVAPFRSLRKLWSPLLPVLRWCDKPRAQLTPANTALVPVNVEQNDKL